MDTKEAILLAGGLGTRIKDILPDIPKCMAPVSGKPFLTYVLSYLETQGIDKVILSVGYLKDHIINYFGNKYQTISITYSIENEPLGTGGAIRLALSRSHSENVFVLNGDTFFTINMAAMNQFHLESGSGITIAVKHVDDASRYGVVEINNKNRITSFREKENNTGCNWINGGVYLINNQILKHLNKEKFSFENDFLKRYHSSLDFYAFKSNDFFLDMGIPEDYNLAQEVLLKPDNHAGQD